MEDKSKCEHCKKWKEEIYWEHFSSIHFLLNLTPNFHDYLVLPEKFTAHMKSQLQDKVFLKGPSGAIWEIELLKSDSLLFVGNGWKDFVKVNKLKENCVLMFKFKRNSCFEVLIFDQGSSCEKEATYFAIDNSGEEDSVSAESNKSKKDEEDVVSSGGLEDTEALRKHELDADTKAREVTRRILPHRSSIKRKFRFGTKSFRYETGKERIQNSQGDVIILESDEIFSDTEHSEEFQPQEKLSKNHIANDVISISETESITNENEDSLEVMECSKSHSDPVHTPMPPLQVYIRRKKRLETQDKEGKEEQQHGRCGQNTSMNH